MYSIAGNKIKRTDSASIKGTMEYHFVSFRLFVIGCIILMIAFLLVIIGGARIDITANSEPFIMTFEIILDQNAKNVLFNLNTIPYQIVNKKDTVYEKEYIILKGQKGENGASEIVFKADDLKRLVMYNAATVFEKSGDKKQIVKFDPFSWEITTVDKDTVLGPEPEPSARYGAGVIHILVSLQEEVMPIYDIVRFKDMIRFKSKRIAQEALSSISGIRWVDIDIFPLFYSRLPIFDSRMKFFIHP